MTGYGYKEYQDEKIRFTLEIKTYNNRYLDLILNLPAPLSPLESRVRSLVSSTIRRGRVEIYLRMKELEEDISLIVDEEAVKSYAGTLNRIREIAGIETPLSLGHLISMDGVIKTEKNRDIENYWILLEPLFADVLQQVREDRRREGASTAEDISRQVSFLESRVGEIETLAPGMEEQINRSLRDKFDDLLEGKADESRILSEIAVQLVRFDINEEIVRLKTHFENFRDVSAHDDEPIGKKLDFLCQEINREINTIGSKSTLVEINQFVVEMKDSLEKVREQLRNVE